MTYLRFQHYMSAQDNGLSLSDGQDHRVSSGRSLSQLQCYRD
jgi:hypothetical protein